MDMAEKAVAYINAGTIYPAISGKATFENVPGGVLVTTEIYGLPPFSRELGRVVGPFGFHLHDGANCTPGSNELPFPYVGGHYNPESQPHPNHAGDFPNLYAHDGAAWMSFFTPRFKVDDIVGLNIVVHESPDDGRTQPNGDAGRMIACGIVREFIESEA
jgi:Cu-Zn family superoxide dismutase